MGERQRIVLLAASNCPWDLDPAMRRRLEKRIYIPLPDVVGRTALLEILLRNIPISSDVNLPSLVQMTNGFSGSDIQIICRDASMMPMRRLLDLFSAQDLVEMKKSGDLLVPKVSSSLHPLLSILCRFSFLFGVFSTRLLTPSRYVCDSGDHARL